MISNLFDRQREIRDSYSLNADPFVLLKEVTEMSRLYNESKQDPMEQQYNRAQYDAFTKSTYEKAEAENSSLFSGKNDPTSVEEKMKRFRFVAPS